MVSAGNMLERFGLKSNISIFKDDAQICRVNTEMDNIILQRDLDRG